MNYSPAHLQLARHVIGWSLVPPILATNLPTTIPDSQAYYAAAQHQLSALTLALGVQPQAFGVFLAGGGRPDSFFRQQRARLPWMDGGSTEEAVLEDLAWTGSEIARLRNILAVWRSEDPDLASEASLTPLTSIRALNRLFRGYSSFASDLLPILTYDLSEGVRLFYDAGERRRRGLNPPQGSVSPSSRKNPSALA